MRPILQHYLGSPKEQHLEPAEMRKRNFETPEKGGDYRYLSEAAVQQKFLWMTVKHDQVSMLYPVLLLNSGSLAVSSGNNPVWTTFPWTERETYF